MSKIIHKACSPKYDYCNPTLCCAKISDGNAHKYSRVLWSKVTCKKCLAKKVK